MDKKKNIKFFERPEKRAKEAKPITKDLMEIAQDKIKSYFQTLQKISKEKSEERKRQAKINRDRELQRVWEETQLGRQEEIRKKVSALTQVGGYTSNHRSEPPQMEKQAKLPAPIDPSTQDFLKWCFTKEQKEEIPIWKTRNSILYKGSE